MTSFFHFEDKVHHKNLSRDESIPFLFPRLLSQVLEHLGFPVEPRLEHRQDCESTFTVKKWQSMPGTPHLPLQDLVEDQPANDYPTEDQPPPVVPTQEPQIPVSTAPIATAPLPTSPASSTPLVPPTPSDSTGPSTSTSPL